MPTIIAHHDVDDSEHWLASSGRGEFFATLGITNVRTEEAGAAMQADGVHPDTLVLLVEA